MAKFLVILFQFTALFYISASTGDEEIRCINTSCKKTVCEAIPPKCKSNGTNPGIHMLSPDFCNCCDYCLVYLAEGEECSIGNPTNGKHTSLCGPGLTCTPSEEGGTDGTCTQMSTVCAQAQQDYDRRREDGLLGTMELRTSCDDDGLYSTYKCIPGQTCHCRHSNGTRIFGEANYNTIPNYMSCGCSRQYYDAVDIQGRNLQPHEHFRCTPEGDFDRIQCINDKCLCVDSEDGAPTYPDRDLVKLKNISNATLPCYTSKTPGRYYKACEKEYMKIYKEVEEKKNTSGYSLVFGYIFPKCDLDGTYSPVQENKTSKYCVDKKGKTLLALNKTDSSLETLLETMDCKCIRASLVMSTIEKPQCLENGNYNPMQWRRGVGRCVDSDGSQKCSSNTAVANLFNLLSYFDNFGINSEPPSQS